MNEHSEPQLNANTGGKLMDHEYDGIQEFDNPAPGWWHLILWGCVAFSVCYALFFHFSIFGSTISTRWADAQAAYFEEIFGEIGTLDRDEETILAMASDERWMTMAQSIYAVNCSACHGGDGSGGTGPNLTDDYYIHCDDLESLLATIDKGVVSKGMPEWGPRLGNNQLVLVSAYLAKLRTDGTKPGKGPEGEQVAPWPAFETPVSLLD